MYAGALSLFGVAGERVPLLVVVDDAHWLDRPSVEALTFAAIRLTAESLALLFAVRAGQGTDLGVALPELELEPLEVAASMELLHERFGSTIDPKVAHHLAEATDGNPLALLEVAALLDEGERVGREPLPDHLPASESVERTVRRALRSLPPEARRELLVAAASDSPTVGDLAALEPAEEPPRWIPMQAPSVAFRHPLVRSAVYHAASADERRAAHRALADALTGRRGCRPARLAPRSGRRRARRVDRRGSRSCRLALCRTRRSSVDFASTRARSRAQRRRRRARPPASGRRTSRLNGRATWSALRCLPSGPEPARATEVCVPADRALALQANEWRGVTFMTRLRSRAKPESLARLEPVRASLLLAMSSHAAWRSTRPRACAATGAEKCRDLAFGRRHLAGRGPLGSPWMADVAANNRSLLAFILLLLGRLAEADAAIKRVPGGSATRLSLSYDAYLERYDEARSNIERELRSSRTAGDVWAELWLTRSLAFGDLLEGYGSRPRAPARLGHWPWRSRWRFLMRLLSALASSPVWWRSRVASRRRASTLLARMTSLSAGSETFCCGYGFKRRSVYSSWVSRARWLRSRSSDRVGGPGRAPRRS